MEIICFRLFLTIAGTGHVADIYSPAASDPPDLQEARVQIVSYLNDLLSGQLDQSSSSSSSLQNDIGNLGDALNDIDSDQKSVVGNFANAQNNKQSNPLFSLKKRSSARTTPTFEPPRHRFDLVDLLDGRNMDGLLDEPSERSPGTLLGTLGGFLMPGAPAPSLQTPPMQTSTQSNADNKIVANTLSVETPAPTETPAPPSQPPAPPAQPAQPARPAQPPAPPVKFVPPTSYTPSQYVPDTPSEVQSNNQQRHSTLSSDSSHKKSSDKNSTTSFGSLKLLSTKSLDLLSVLSDDTLSQTSATSTSSIPARVAPTPVTPSESEFYNENLNANPADLTPDRDSGANATAENAEIYAILHPKKKPDPLKLKSFNDILNFSFSKHTKGPKKHNDNNHHDKDTKKPHKAGKITSYFSIGISLNALPSFPNLTSTSPPVIGLPKKAHKAHANHTAAHNTTIKSHSTTYPQFAFAKSDVFSVESTVFSQLQLPSFISSKIFQESDLVTGAIAVAKT